MQDFEIVTLAIRCTLAIMVFQGHHVICDAAIVGQDTTSIVKSNQSTKQSKYRSLFSLAEIKLIRKDQIVVIMGPICQVTYCKVRRSGPRKTNHIIYSNSRTLVFCPSLRVLRNFQSSDIGTSVSIVETGVAFEI